MGLLHPSFQHQTQEVQGHTEDEPHGEIQDGGTGKQETTAFLALAQGKVKHFVIKSLRNIFIAQMKKILPKVIYCEDLC